jgi:hypothetical protein
MTTVKSEKPLITEVSYATMEALRGRSLVPVAEFLSL